MALPSLSQKEWLALMRRVTGFAFAMYKKQLGKSSTEDAKDIAQEAMAQLYDPEKYAPWDPEKDPDLFDDLAKRVINVISNRRRMAYQRNRQLGARQWKRLDSGMKTPEEIFAERELAGKILDGIDDELGDDKQGRIVNDCYRAAVDEAADQSTHTGLEIEDIRRARRRYFDAAERVRARLVPDEEDDE